METEFDANFFQTILGCVAHRRLAPPSQQKLNPPPEEMSNNHLSGNLILKQFTIVDVSI